MACPNRQNGVASMIRQIMHPQCEACSDTGVVCGPKLDSENPDTYSDWTYCTCRRGTKAMRDDNKLEEEMEDRSDPNLSDLGDYRVHTSTK